MLRSFFLCSVSFFALTMMNENDCGTLKLIWSALCIFSIHNVLIIFEALFCSVAFLILRSSSTFAIAKA